MHIPPPQVLEWRALLELYQDLRIQHTGWAQRIQAVCFHQGATAPGQAGIVRGDRARLPAIVDARPFNPLRASLPRIVRAPVSAQSWQWMAGLHDATVNASGSAGAGREAMLAKLAGRKSTGQDAPARTIPRQPSTNGARGRVEDGGVDSPGEDRPAPCRADFTEPYLCRRLMNALVRETRPS